MLQLVLVPEAGIRLEEDLRLVSIVSLPLMEGLEVETQLVEAALVVELNTAVSPGRRRTNPFHDVRRLEHPDRPLVVVDGVVEVALPEGMSSLRKGKRPTRRGGRRICSGWPARGAVPPYCSWPG